LVGSSTGKSLGFPLSESCPRRSPRGGACQRSSVRRTSARLLRARRERCGLQRIAAEAQEIVVENRAGASGNIGMEASAKAAPDGYTNSLGNIGTIAINPAIFRNLSVNPIEDLIPVTLVTDVPNLLIANPSVPANNVAEPFAYAKANPGALNFASTGSGSLSRLEMEQFRKVATIDVVHILYKGGAGPAFLGMLSGETHAMFVTVASALSFVQAGRLKALGISSTRRIDALPQVPTMVEAGFPEMVSDSWQGVFVPGGTPRPIVDKLHLALLATLGSPEIREALVGRGGRGATTGFRRLESLPRLSSSSIQTVDR
jgi:tripartite-type tricarboxylate transporter receptor subunit TctC